MPPPGRVLGGKTYQFAFPALISVYSVYIKVKVKQSRYRPGVAQKVPGS
jgi:hypothetical protein